MCVDFHEAQAAKEARAAEEAKVKQEESDGKLFLRMKPSKTAPLGVVKSEKEGDEEIDLIMDEMLSLECPLAITRIRSKRHF